MENQSALDTLATAHSWVQGTQSKPFTSLVGLYIDQQMDLAATITEIISVINEVYYNGDHSGVDTYLTDLWSTILHTSKKLPRQNHGQRPDEPTALQARLAALLSSLKAQPDPAPIPRRNSQTEPTSPRQNNQLSWSALPLLKETVQESLNDEPGARAAFTDAEVLGWENLTDFLALVCKGGIVALEDIAVRMMVVALEERHDEGGWEAGGEKGKGRARRDETKHATEITRLNAYVACAGIWGMEMGEELWERVGETETQKGEGRISKERWEAWIERFEFFSLRQDLNIISRELAAEAGVVMCRAM